MNQFVKALASGMTLAISSLLAATNPSTAAVLQNGWQYAIDPGNDSYGSVNGTTQVGGTIYEIYGMAIKQDTVNNRIWVALNSNLPLTGHDTGPTITADGRTFNIRNNSVAWGDLFFDFSTDKFGSSDGANSFFGIRFSPNNDGTLTPGVYGNITGRNVAGFNAGFQNLNQYNQFVRDKTGDGDRNTWVGELAWNNPYFDPYTSPGSWSNPATLMPNVIGSGNRLGDVTNQTQAELTAQGFDPNFFFTQGSEIFGFSFEKPADFTGDFIATLLQECINDGVSLLGNFAPPLPPPPPPPAECTVSLGQRYALQPTSFDGDTKVFNDIPSNLWYDPDPNMGYDFTATNGTSFSQILAFPCGLAIGDRFKVIVPSSGGQQTFSKTFQVGDSLDFLTQQLIDVRNFKIEFEVANPQTTPGFSIQLRFNEETGNFTMTPYTPTAPEPSSILGFVTFGVMGIAARKLRKRT